MDIGIFFKKSRTKPCGGAVTLHCGIDDEKPLLRVADDKL